MDEYKRRSPIDGIGIVIILLLLFAGLATGMAREMVGQVGTALQNAPPLVTVQNADGTGWRSNGSAPAGCAAGYKYNPSTGGLCP